MRLKQRQELRSFVRKLNPAVAVENRKHRNTIVPTAVLRRGGPIMTLLLTSYNSTCIMFEVNIKY